MRTMPCEKCGKKPRVWIYDRDPSIGGEGCLVQCFCVRDNTLGHGADRASAVADFNEKTTANGGKWPSFMQYIKWFLFRLLYEVLGAGDATVSVDAGATHDPDTGVIRATVRWNYERMTIRGTPYDWKRLDDMDAPLTGTQRQHISRMLTRVRDAAIGIGS